MWAPSICRTTVATAPGARKSGKSEKVRAALKVKSHCPRSTAAEPRTRASPGGNSHHQHYHHYLDYLRLDPRARPPIPRTGASKSAARRASQAATPQGGKGAAPPVRCRGGIARAAAAAVASRTSRRRARGSRRNPAAMQAGRQGMLASGLGCRPQARRAAGWRRAGGGLGRAGAGWGRTGVAHLCSQLVSATRVQAECYLRRK